MSFVMFAAILLCGSVWMSSCNGNAGNGETAADSTATAAAETEALSAQEMAFFAAIDQYLTDSIASHYSPGEVCIPCYAILAANNDPEGEGTLAWGDYWVYNYNVVGDTLKMVSGGHHPGLIHLKNTDDGLKVVAFDQVADGSQFKESAQAIFGDLYDDFTAFASDDNQREGIRKSSIAEYVKKHNLPVKYYQDYGWPAVEIPAE